jgi:hypothetical protein
MPVLHVVFCVFFMVYVLFCFDRHDDYLKASLVNNIHEFVTGEVIEVYPQHNHKFQIEVETVDPIRGHHLR